MSDDRDRIDFSALDEPVRRARSVDAVLARVAPALRARRRREPLVWLELAHWRAPVLAAAAVLFVTSLAVLVRVRPAAPAGGATAVTAGASGPATLAQAAGLPSSLAAWVETGTPPAPASAFEVGGYRP